MFNLNGEFDRNSNGQPHDSLRSCAADPGPSCQPITAHPTRPHRLTQAAAVAHSSLRRWPHHPGSHIPFPRDSAMLHRLVGKRHVATPRLREAQKRKPVATEGGACLQLQPLQERSDQVRFYTANPLRFSRRPPRSIARFAGINRGGEIRALTASTRAASGVFPFRFGRISGVL